MTRTTGSDEAPTAQRPQQRVIRAAADLFAQHGYAATSIRQIAGRAKVSLDTIYACGGKAEIFLRAMELTLSGSPEETPLLEGQGMDEVWQAPTAEEVVSGLVEVTVAATARSVDIWTAFLEGASSDASLRAAMIAKNEAMRAEGRKTVEFLKGRGMCPTDIDTDRVADLMWAEAHPHRYALLVGLAGWTTEEFAAQLTATILELLR